jgi:hypothetical protein
MINGRTTGLNDKHVAPTDIVFQLDARFIIFERSNDRPAQIETQTACDFLCQRTIGVATENKEASIHNNLRTLQFIVGKANPIQDSATERYVCQEQV